MGHLFEPPEDQQVFSRSFVPGPVDIDANGHVNNVVYLSWAQDLAITHWEAWTTPEQRAGWSWVARRHEIDYRRELRLDEIATGHTFDRYVRIDGPDGAMCAQVRTTWCLIEREGGRPRRVPTEMVARFIDPA